MLVHWLALTALAALPVVVHKRSVVRSQPVYGVVLNDAVAGPHAGRSAPSSTSSSERSWARDHRQFPPAV